jgi:hypothetical protein
MKQSIRYGVFETNSSSTHSVVLLNDKEYNDWKDGKIRISIYGDIITKEELDEQLAPRIQQAIEYWEKCAEDAYPKTHHKTAQDYVKSIAYDSDYDERWMTIVETERDFNGEHIHGISLNTKDD